MKKRKSFIANRALYVANKTLTFTTQGIAPFLKKIEHYAKLYS